ncbi:MAG: ParB/RepB/Spo0J family partition protein [Sphingomonas sp.]|jgi:ParB family chromosome partitioning protein|uniref:ParB/RepB/Spo0J family partition protein n=1 Tax=Sphingomonas sp. TaxID=28214 RepID=UPI0035659CF3
MAKPNLKLVLSPSRDIPFDKLILSQSNVRRIKSGVSIGALAEDIVRRTLLQSLNVRPVLDGEGQETGMFEVPAGGRRYRALELLVTQKRLARNAPIPCVVRVTVNDGDPTAEEDSLAENTHREQLHPLDQFRAMKALVDQGSDIDAVAAHFMTTPAVVRQRLRLASVSPKLHEIYAEDGMTLEQLMAFSVCENRARQEQVWDLLQHSWNKSGGYIRQKLTEDTVRASDRRVQFVGLDAYLAAGGAVMRDLFEADNGGWLQDIPLLDQLVVEKLGAEGERIGAEGWKWVAVATDFAYGETDGLREIEGAQAEISAAEQERIDALKAEADAIEAQYENATDIPDEVEARIEAIDDELARILERPVVYDPAEMARAGAFVSLDHDGALYIERGFVRPEDELPSDAADRIEGGETSAVMSYGPQQPDGPAQGATVTIGADAGEDDDEVVRPLPDRLIGELTAYRTLALRDAFAASPSIAFMAVLHAMALSIFYYASRESCLGISINRATFPHQEPGMKDSPSAKSIGARHKLWEDRLPESDKDLWDALALFDSEDQAALFAHCAAYGVNALWEPTSRYDGRVSAHAVERRLEHSHILARTVGLDMVSAGWKPTVDNYLGRVTKPRILEAVTEAKGEQTAGLIDHLKKGDMAREAARLLDDSGWLPEPLRTPVIERPADPEARPVADAESESDLLPAFLDAGEEPPAGEGDIPPEYAVAAE